MEGCYCNDLLKDTLTVVTDVQKSHSNPTQQMALRWLWVHSKLLLSAESNNGHQIHPSIYPSSLFCLSEWGHGRVVPQQRPRLASLQTFYPALLGESGGQVFPGASSLGGRSPSFSPDPSGVRQTHQEHPWCPSLDFTFFNE